MMIVTLRGLAAIAAASLFAGLPLAAAQEPAAGGSPPWQAPAGAVGSDVGTGWNILQIPASAFAPLNGTMSYTIDHDGYLEYGGSLSPFLLNGFAAPVQLPSGAGIGYVGLYARDIGPEKVLAILRRHTGYGIEPQCPLPIPRLCPSIPPGHEDLAQVESMGDSGYQYVYATMSPLHTVVNHRLFGGGQYTVYVSLPQLFYYFKGVDIWWKRQISPAPAAARFTDVPLGAAFFAEVEALAASGITVGCTATEFCPEAPLTRRQMAAFLARALGLYYQY